MKTKSWILSCASAFLITGFALFTPNQTEANVKNPDDFKYMWIGDPNDEIPGAYCVPMIVGDCDYKVLPPIVIIPDP